MWEGEGDPVEGCNIWVEYWLVIRWVQEPALSTIGDQQHQANNVIVVTIECVSSTHLPLLAQVSDRMKMKCSKGSGTMADTAIYCVNVRAKFSQELSNLNNPVDMK